MFFINTYVVMNVRNLRKSWGLQNSKKGITSRLQKALNLHKSLTYNY